MPQMAPTSWLILFIVFIMTFILFNVMNYFSYFPSIPSHQKKSESFISMNWKW